MKRSRFSLFAMLLSVLLLPAAGSAQTVVDIASGNDDFETLVTAVKAADLAGTLSGKGPFTVFAPTDDAFDALPSGLVAALVKPENKATLQKILTYHVAAGKLMASDVLQAVKGSGGTFNAGTVEGGKFSVMTKNGKVMIRDAQGNVANVVKTDISGSNGVIHVLDRVLLPAGVNPAALLGGGMAPTAKPADYSRMAKVENSIVDIASSSDDFETLTAAVGAADLGGMLGGAGEYTVFAPTDDAFDMLPDGTVRTLTTTQKDKLKGILAFHTVPAPVMAGDLVSAIQSANNYLSLPTLGNQTLVATVVDGQVQLIDGNGNRATVIKTDIKAGNGVVHVIDRVLLPK